MVSDLSASSTSIVERQYGSASKPIADPIKALPGMWRHGGKRIIKQAAPPVGLGAVDSRARGRRMPTGPNL